MKRLFALLLILFVGCVQVKMELDSGEKVVTFEETAYDYDVRLTDKGFDTDSATVRAGDSIVIYIEDAIRNEDVHGHYITLNNNRVTDKELRHGDQVQVDFDTPGSYVLADETRNRNF